MPPPAPDDPVALVESQLFGAVLLLIQIRARAAVEDRLAHLEAAVGRDLPEVRAQLSRLFGDAPEPLMLAAPADPSATPPTDLVVTKRPPGRPPKGSAPLPPPNSL